ncbi:MAG: hypothetical protein EXR31_08870 [Betaproteobacteria bacterium]|nr:hypothetical protein [Betaproteobacteria bacterium]
MGTADTIVVVDPAAEDASVTLAAAPRLSGLAGTHVAMIDNSKHMAGELLLAIETLLQQRHGVRQVTRYRKSNASVPTPPAVLAGLIAACDAVVHGVAD